MVSARKLKRRTAAHITSKLLYAVTMSPDGGDVGLTVFQSRRRAAHIHMPKALALQLSALIAEAATGRRVQ